MSILVGQLIQDQKLICASPTQHVNEVFKIMIDNDFSQMPVINEASIPIGILTSDSIARALMHFGAKIEELRVRDAMIKVSLSSNTCKIDEELLDILDIFLTTPAILITESNDKLIGLITEYDTTKYFRQRAEDIVIVSDIENALKQHLLTAYDSLEKESDELKKDISSLSNYKEVAKQKGMKSLKSLQALYTNDKGSAKGKAKEEIKDEGKNITQKQLDEIIDKNFPTSGDPKSFYDLTLSEFMQLANKAWPQLSSAFQIESSLWNRMMDEVRLTRNKLAHFRGDTTTLERRQLRFCSDWFKLHPAPPKPVAETDTATELTDEAIAAEDQAKPEESSSTAASDATQKTGSAQAATTVIESKPLSYLTRPASNLRIDTDSKYKPLVDYLNVPSRDTLSRVAFRFAQIEALIKQSLPKAAREHATWWTNSVTTQASVWIMSGWRASEVDLSTERVVYSRWLPGERNQRTRRVSLANPWEVLYWTTRFERNERDIAEAIKAVGHLPTKVSAYLVDNQARPLQNEGDAELV